MSLFDSLKSYLADERLVATATVMAVPEGSVAEVGAKVIILPDGTTEGTLEDVFVALAGRTL